MNLQIQSVEIKDLAVQDATNEKILLTIKDIQEVFQCGKNYAYSLTKLKGFPTIKIGKKIFVPKDKLKKWIDENTNTEIEL